MNSVNGDDDSNDEEEYDSFDLGNIENTLKHNDIQEHKNPINKKGKVKLENTFPRYMIDYILLK